MATFVWSVWTRGATPLRLKTALNAKARRLFPYLPLVFHTAGRLQRYALLPPASTSLELQLRNLLVILLMAVASSVWATTVEPMPLKEMVQGATLIAVATSDSVYGRTDDGAILLKGKFRTGPGSGNTLVSKMRILRVLRGTALVKGAVYDVEYWPGWHMETDLAKRSKPYPVILMLKEAEGAIVPVFPPEPWVDGRSENQVREMLKMEK